MTAPRVREHPTRATQASELSRLLRAAGYEPLEAPAIEIVPAWDRSRAGVGRGPTATPGVRLARAASAQRGVVPVAAWLRKRSTGRDYRRCRFWPQRPRVPSDPGRGASRSTASQRSAALAALRSARWRVATECSCRAPPRAATSWSTDCARSGSASMRPCAIERVPLRRDRVGRSRSAARDRRRTLCSPSAATRVLPRWLPHRAKLWCALATHRRRGTARGFRSPPSPTDEHGQPGQRPSASRWRSLTRGARLMADAWSWSASATTPRRSKCASAWRSTRALASSCAASGATVLLSTCNRVEVYAWASGTPATALEPRARARSGGGHAVADLQALPGAARGSRGAAHLVRVAAGLDSLVVGEEQIRGQIREAVRLAEPVVETAERVARACSIDAAESARRVRGGDATGQRAVDRLGGGPRRAAFAARLISLASRLSCWAPASWPRPAAQLSAVAGRPR